MMIYVLTTLSLLVFYERYTRRYSRLLHTQNMECCHHTASQSVSGAYMWVLARNLSITRLLTFDFFNLQRSQARPILIRVFDCSEAPCLITCFGGDLPGRLSLGLGITTRNTGRGGCDSVQRLVRKIFQKISPHFRFVTQVWMLWLVNNCGDLQCSRCLDIQSVYRLEGLRICPMDEKIAREAVTPHPSFGHSSV